MQKEEYQVPFDERLIQNEYQKYSHKRFIEMLNDKKIDRALGCLFGAFIGDALGAFLEFNNNINKQLLNKAMEMKGGGTYNLRPGQVTDDSELSFHLFYGLTKYDPQRSLDSQINQIIANICLEYVKWKKSKPFDIGNTCRIGINKIEEYKDKLQANNNLKQVLDELESEIYKINFESQSNGSLMRITPLPFFLSLIQTQGNLLIQKQIKLLHPNIYNVAAGKIWAGMLIDLINRKNDNQLTNIYQKALKKANEDRLSQWVDAANTKQPMNAKVNIGWSKIAWSFGLGILKLIANRGIQSSSDQYVKYIKEVIGRGGDTDTNASIVGGMLGAIIGFKKLPFKYLTTLMNLDYNQKQKKKTDRNHIYQPRHFFARVYWFIEKIKKGNQTIFPQKNHQNMSTENKCTII